MTTTIHMPTEHDARAEVARITTGETVGYGVGNTYPETYTVIRRPFEISVWRNENGARAALTIVTFAQ